MGFAGVDEVVNSARPPIVVIENVLRLYDEFLQVLA
jgi:hypothetical protein